MKTLATFPHCIVDAVGTRSQWISSRKKHCFVFIERRQSRRDVKLWRKRCRQFTEGAVAIAVVCVSETFWKEGLCFLCWKSWCCCALRTENLSSLLKGFCRNLKASSIKHWIFSKVFCWRASRLIRLCVWWNSCLSSAISSRGSLDRFRHSRSSSLSFLRKLCIEVGVLDLRVLFFFHLYL